MMNDAHLHLIVNHLPIIFPLAGIVVLLVGLIARAEAVNRAAYLLFIIGAIAAAAAMATGEGAEEVVEKLNGVGENYIHKHEEAAELFAVLSYLLGALSLAGLWASYAQKTFSRTITIVVLVFSLITLFFARQTGTTGGEIRHTEIRSDSSMPATESSDSEKESHD